MGAVSPAVIIPCLFELQDLGYGVNKGIHTLVIAASTLDDIVCIACFGIIIGIIFSTGRLLTHNIKKKKDNSFKLPEMFGNNFYI